MSRIVIAGGPRTGKTTLALRLVSSPTVFVVVPGAAPMLEVVIPHGLYLRHTDDLIATHSWSEASQVVSEWFDAPGPWLIEGVTVSRALRKWRAQHPGEPPPVDRCIYLTKQYEPLSRGDIALAIGVETIHGEIASWLKEHHVGA